MAYPRLISGYAKRHADAAAIWIFRGIPKVDLGISAANHTRKPNGLGLGLLNNLFLIHFLGCTRSGCESANVHGGQRRTVAHNRAGCK